MLDCFWPKGVAIHRHKATGLLMYTSKGKGRTGAGVRLKLASLGGRPLQRVLNNWLSGRRADAR